MREILCLNIYTFARRMIKTATQEILKNICLIVITGVFFLCSLSASAQRTDTVQLPAKGKIKPVSRAPQIKANIPVYKAPSQYKSFGTLPASSKAAVKSDKNLTINKIYPNPVTDQVSVVVRLEKEAQLSIRIMDQLGNSVVTLMDERTGAGEQTKTFTLPKKLNTGIYFLRLIAGQESVIKRISVL